MQPKLPGGTDIGGLVFAQLTIFKPQDPPVICLREHIVHISEDTHAGDVIVSLNITGADGGRLGNSDVSLTAEGLYRSK